MEWIMLLGGLVLLILGGDFLVKGGVSIATKFKISPLVIGLTVVAFGTSAPELLVSLESAIIGQSEIAIGNVVGSNIANIALILGLSALLYPLSITKDTVKFDIPIMIFASIIFTLAAINGRINRFEGIIGVLFLIAFILIQLHTSKDTITKEEQKSATSKTYPIWLAIIIVISSCFFLTFGADLLIEGATSIAKRLGVSQRIIGVTIVAFGTSLPELATSAIAAIKKQSDIAIGNIVGSNIFNIFCIIGLTSSISPIPVVWNIFKFDFFWMCSLSLLLLLLIIFSKSLKLTRISGLVLILTYAAYLYIIL